MNNKLIQGMILGVAIAVLWTMEAGAALPLKRSEYFPNLYEMDNVAQGVDPTAATGQWSLPAGAGGTASLSGGLLNLSTSYSGQHYWRATTQAVHSVGSTMEARVRLDSSVSDPAYPSYTNLVWLLTLGDNNDQGILYLGVDRVVWLSTGAVLDTNPNTGGFHVFRIAQDANASVYQVWRDEVQIGTNLLNWTGAGYPYFGDGSTGSGGTGAWDYVRLDYTGGFSIPEPTSIVLLGVGMLLRLKRRRES